MTARTHDLAAITALSVVALSQPLPEMTLGTALIALLANQIGGIAPDIDQPTAPFWRNLPVAGILGKFFGRLLGGHRFLSHSIIGVVLFGLLAKFLLGVLQPIMPTVDIGLVWWAFMIGLVSHLLMDMLTKEGVPWLLPLPWKFGFPPIKKLRIVTGKKREALIFLLLLGFEVLYVAAHYQQLMSIIHDKIV